MRSVNCPAWPFCVDEVRTNPPLVPAMRVTAVTFLANSPVGTTTSMRPSRMIFDRSPWVCGVVPIPAGVFVSPTEYSAERPPCSSAAALVSPSVSAWPGAGAADALGFLACHVAGPSAGTSAGAIASAPPLSSELISACWLRKPMLPATINSVTTAAAIEGQRRSRWVGRRGGRDPRPPRPEGLGGSTPAFLCGDMLEVGFQLLQVADVRVHDSTSELSCSPRSCSTSATRRSPRLTRCRAFASEHRSRSATSR